MARIAGKSALVCLLTDPIDAEVLDAAGPSLKIVANVAVGFNNIDLAACRARGVVVTNTPDVLDERVRRLHVGADPRHHPAVGRRRARTSRGSMERLGARSLLGMELRGKQLGLVGLGRIARAVAAKAPAFGMSVAFTDQASADLEDATQMPLDRLLVTSDVVSLHVPLTQGTTPSHRSESAGEDAPVGLPHQHVARTGG